MSLYKTLTLGKIKEEVPGVKSFIFEEPDTGQIQYQAGQYLTFVIPGGEQEVRRSYSITSSPALAEPLSIVVKRVPNGIFSRHMLDHARPGDKLQTIGAGGFFTLPADLSDIRQIFFFAAGSGIAPIYSLMKTVLHTYPQISVVLIYSNNAPQSTIYLQELQQLEKAFRGSLQIEFLFSISKNLSRARLYKDLLKALLKEYATVPGHQLLSYICGPVNYMRMCVYGLRQANVPAENIRREIFHIPQIVHKIEPPDTDLHRVTFRLGGQSHQLEVQYPDTILDAARKKGISLPYSCELGRCGNCVAKCRKGQVWMLNNEVLTERDLEQGLILTCVGYPIGGDVVLEA
ncbi:flavin reductase family protein [Cesiribacter sp. SM1]|uniref:flavin reductase family protein n=1 Tax=Cesiribacter sp. SM1 TaxID=2861196 RepID=UPI001CD2ED98|nr:iron-sulfur cluster-binding domain-containing protein [Cesiribacter sp. SM1]